MRLVVLDGRAIARQRRRRWRDSWARHIANHRICRSRKGVIGLPFDESMVYDKRRPLVSSRRIECPSVHRAEEVPGRWISDNELRHIDGNRAVRLEVARRISRSNHRLRGNTDDQSDDGGGNRAVLEGWRSPCSRSHADVVLLARRGERVPDYPPPAVWRHIV